MASDPRLVQSYNHWRLHPLQWVKDKFSQALKDGRIKLPAQHVEYWEVLGLLIRAKLKKHRGEKLSADEQEAVQKIGISIMAAQGVGKDFVGGMTVCFFLDCFPKVKIPCTGVNAQHLRSVLWSEVSKVMSLSNRPKSDNMREPTNLESLLEWQTDRIFHKSNKQQQFAEAITINKNSSRDDQAKTLYGRHADVMLIVCDEADGIPDVVFGPLEGTLTGMINLALCLFNPTRSSGYAYDSHYRPGIMEKWARLQWSQLDSELVTREHIANMARYGEDSNKYRVRVLGLPPIAEAGCLLPDQWIFDAQWREIEPLQDDPIIAGIDVGGGGDKSVMCIRQGGKVLKFLYNSDKDAMSVVDWVLVQMDYNDVRVGIVDVVGLGAGIYSRLNQMRVNVRPWDSRNTSRYPDKYFNKRTEMYMNLRDQFESGVIALPQDGIGDLIEELKAVGYNAEKKCQVELKDVIRKKLGGDSPDSADALALSYAYPDEIFRAAKVHRWEVKYQNMGII